MAFKIILSNTEGLDLMPTKTLNSFQHTIRGLPTLFQQKQHFKGIPRCQHMFGLYCLKWKENIYSSSLLTKRSVCLKFYKFSSCFLRHLFEMLILYFSKVRSRLLFVKPGCDVECQYRQSRQGEKCLSTLISSNPSGNIKKKQTLRLMTSGKISKTV